ncbi:hypothetical protein Tco_1541987 [Tanacetum coccineum]
MSEEFEASEPSGIRTISSHSPVSSDSTAPLSPDHTLTHVSPILTPTRVLFHRRTACMTMCDHIAMSLGHSVRVAEAMALSDLAFRKSEGDELGDEDTKEDVEDKSQGLDDKSQGLDDESQGLDDKSQGLDDESQGLDDESQGLKDEGPGLGYRAARHRALESTKEIAPSTFKVDPEDGRVYTDIPAYVPLDAHVQTPPSPEWSSGSLPISPSSPVVPSPIASSVATLTATISIDEDQFIERYRFKSLEQEQERATHATMQHELQEMRGRVTALEQKRSRREQ